MKTEKIERESHVIKTDMFKPTGKRIGYGCWGQVDLYEDETGNKWALKYFNPNEIAKKQMQERGWTEDEVMLKEGIPLSAAQHNVVPRIVARDKKGKMYTAMPYYSEGDLSAHLYGLDEKQKFGIMKDIARAIKYIHDNKIDNSKERGIFAQGSAYGDVKPANFIFDKGRVHLSDLGSTTCVTIGGNGRKRGEYGDINYRAPEVKDETARPNKRADIWGLGAMFYEILTGKGIKDNTEKLTQKIINKKLKDIPQKPLRKTLSKMLVINPNERYFDGGNVLRELESAIEKYEGKNGFWSHVKKWTLPLAIPITALSLCAYGSAVHEPKKLEMPKTHRIEGVLYAPEHEDKNSLEFIAENINDLPEASIPLGIMVPGINQYSKNSTENRVIAYLVKTHMQAALAEDIVPHEGASKKQMEIFFANSTPEEIQISRANAPTYSYPAVAKCIEIALQKSQIEGNKVDLEDVLAMARLGSITVEQAKRLSGSLDWKKYREAKNSKGELIIPRDEREFIDQWLSYYHSDID